MTFAFSAQSAANLVGVHPNLVKVCRRALEITAQDFGITCGVRSNEDQLKAWLRHASKLNGIPVGQTRNGVHGTGRGNHQVNGKDGLGHAVDAVPFVGGIILWSMNYTDAQQWERIYPVMDAMRMAAIELKIRVRSGAVWDRTLNDMTHGGVAAMVREVAEYSARHPGPDFLDGPHVELE